MGERRCTPTDQLDRKSRYAVVRRHSLVGAKPARELSLQPEPVGADEGGNDIVRRTSMERTVLDGSAR